MIATHPFARFTRHFLTTSLITAMPLCAFAWEHDDDDEEAPFDEAFIFFELNNTDGDLGIHAKVDGDEWKRLSIEDPRERRMLKINVRGRLRRQGLTELFFESAEPTFDELDPAVFFARFPEGTYEVEGITLDREELESETEVTHLLPAPPEPSVNGIPIVTDCDEGELPEFDPDEDVVISWAPVTHSHPTLGRTGEPITVVNYEVVVEIDETPWKASAILPPEVTEFQLPAEILGLGDEIKYEVLVREESWNQTAVESCFAIAGAGEDEDEDDEE